MNLCSLYGLQSSTEGGLLVGAGFYDLSEDRGMDEVTSGGLCQVEELRDSSQSSSI
jgi:hypothetical protein